MVGVVSMRVEVLLEPVKCNWTLSGWCGCNVLKSESGPSFTFNEANKSTRASDMTTGQSHTILIRIPATAEVHPNIPACVPFVHVLARDEEIYTFSKFWDTISSWLTMQALVACHLVISADKAFGEENGGVLYQPLKDWMLAWYFGTNTLFKRSFQCTGHVFDLLYSALGSAVALGFPRA